MISSKLLKEKEFLKICNTARLAHKFEAGQFWGLQKGGRRLLSGAVGCWAVSRVAAASFDSSIWLSAF